MKSFYLAVDGAIANSLQNYDSTAPIGVAAGIRLIGYLTKTSSSRFQLDCLCSIDCLCYRLHSFVNHCSVFSRRFPPFVDHHIPALVRRKIENRNHCLFKFVILFCMFNYLFAKVRLITKLTKVIVDF